MLPPPFTPTSGRHLGRHLCTVGPSLLGLTRLAPLPVCHPPRQGPVPNKLLVKRVVPAIPSLRTNGWRAQAVTRYVR